MNKQLKGINMQIIKPNYKNSILGIPASLLNYYGINANYDSIKELDEVLHSKPKNIVYIILDGMGINIMNTCLKKKSFFSSNLKKQITSVYPSTTVCATTALHSGLSGYESGWIGWHLYFKKFNESVELFSNQTYFTRKNVDIYQEMHYQTIYEKIIEKKPDVLYSRIYPKKAGGEFENFDDMCQAVKKICENDKKNLISFYYNEPDHVLHKKGTCSDDLKLILSEIEDKLKNLYSSLDDTIFIITSDHGHTDVEVINLYTDKELINFFSYPPSGEFRSVHFHVKKGMNQKFKKYFTENYGKDFLLYSKKDFFESGILGNNQKNENLDNLTGDFIAVAINNKSLVYITEEMKPRNLLSDHAGLTTDEMLVPLIIINK